MTSEQPQFCATKKKVLVVCSYYLPAFKAGGPIRTIANTVDRLGDEFDFYIVTQNKDGGEPHAFPVPVREWTRVGKANVMYVPPMDLIFFPWRRLLASESFDIVHVNSLFSRVSMRLLALRRIGAVGKVPFILAPRGEFSDGALSLKRRRKAFFLRAARLMGLFRGLVWHASTQFEARDIVRGCGDPDADVRIAPDLLPVAAEDGRTVRRPPKSRGSLRVVFLSRICRMKNLAFAIDVLQRADANVEFTIAGPPDDIEYWGECEARLPKSGGRFVWKYVGAVPHDRVPTVLGEHHLFLLPSLGENFGHVVFEALSAGCMVLLSDRTPWSQLESRGIGWTCSLDDPDAFRRAVEAAAAMDDEEFAAHAEDARRYAGDVSAAASFVQQNRVLLESTVAKSS